MHDITDIELASRFSVRSALAKRIEMEAALAELKLQRELQKLAKETSDWKTRATLASAIAVTLAMHWLL